MYELHQKLNDFRLNIFWNQEISRKLNAWSWWACTQSATQNANFDSCTTKLPENRCRKTCKKRYWNREILCYLILWIYLQYFILRFKWSWWTSYVNWCWKTNIRDFCISFEIKNFFSLVSMFESFIFISYFLDLHKEQKRGKMQYLSQLISCPLAHLFSLSKETFVKNHCLKQDCVIHARHTTPWSRLAVKDHIKIAGKQRYGMLLWYYIFIQILTKLKWTDFSWRLNQFYVRSVFAYMFRILDTWKYQKISKNYSLNFFHKFLYVPLELYMGCVCHYSKLWS